MTLQVVQVQIEVWSAGVAGQAFLQVLQEVVEVEVHVSSVARRVTGPVSALEANLYCYS